MSDQGMLVHTFPTMGTVASLRVVGDPAHPALAPGALEAIERSLAEWDRTFSLYRPDSRLSRIDRGELSLRDAGADVLAAYELALDWRAQTRGNFTPHRPDGVIDLSGIVKAMAIDAAGRLIDTMAADWVLTVGGDVLARGLSPAGLWQCGIVDPADRAALLGTIEIAGNRRAVATSGTAERGDHIWRQDTAYSLVQVTVIADDIVTADVLATSILAGGRVELDHAAERWDIDVISVDSFGELLATRDVRSAWKA